MNGNAVLIVSWIGFSLGLLIMMFVMRVRKSRINQEILKKQVLLFQEVMLLKDYEWAAELIEWFLVCEYLPQDSADKLFIQISMIEQMKSVKNKMKLMYEFNDWELPLISQIEDELILD